ncbi:MJ0042-type zinc finger domain-containing protein, partial [Sphaerotilus sp.]|uniref:MJ0042-type zinc finger domain-containing protein n=1 Tax=Sphaerotilus sp. TaxID=2093942 RepID=UPI0034E1D114
TSQQPALHQDMRITCPHCQHRGFTALAKLKANPAWPVRCKYCKHRSHPEPWWSVLVCGLALGLVTTAGAAWLSQWPWWTVGPFAALLAVGIHQLLLRPSIAINSAVTRRTRVKVLVLGTLALVAALGLLSVAQMSDSAPQASTAPAT